MNSTKKYKVTASPAYDRQVIDEPFDEPFELVLAIEQAHTHKYHLVRKNGIVASLIAPEHVAQQIVRLLNQGQVFYHQENLPPEIERELVKPKKPL